MLFPKSRTKASIATNTQERRAAAEALSYLEKWPKRGRVELDQGLLYPSEGLP